MLSSTKSLAPAAAGMALGNRPPPPLVVASLSLKMHNQAGSQSSEILAASVVHSGGKWRYSRVPVDPINNSRAKYSSSVWMRVAINGDESHILLWFRARGRAAHTGYRMLI